MKKLLVVLLALGLIVAFGMTASAADVKFAGQYYVNGIYESNRTLQDTDHTYSRAFFFTRTRVQTVFQVHEGLSFTTRFDAFEKQWGGVNRSSSNTEDKSNSGKVNSVNVDPPGKHRDGARLCDLQDDGRPVRHRLSGR